MSLTRIAKIICLDERGGAQTKTNAFTCEQFQNEYNENMGHSSNIKHERILHASDERWGWTLLFQNESKWKICLCFFENVLHKYIQNIIINYFINRGKKIPFGIWAFGCNHSLMDDASPLSPLISSAVLRIIGIGNGMDSVSRTRKGQVSAGRRKRAARRLCTYPFLSSSADPVHTAVWIRNTVSIEYRLLIPIEPHMRNSILFTESVLFSAWPFPPVLFYLGIPHFKFLFENLASTSFIPCTCPNYISFTDSTSPYLHLHYHQIWYVSHAVLPSHPTLSTPICVRKHSEYFRNHFTFRSCTKYP